MSQKNNFYTSIFILLSMFPTKSNAQSISSTFPFESRFETVLGSKMHYIEEYVDENNPDQLTFLFLHGNPTSSYLWRNIIPYVNNYGMAVAPDLIGMGQSDKPKLDYTFQDHTKYLEAFIEQKKLDNIILVVHDWGSALGFHYASRHEDKIKGIVFMEAMTRAITWKDANFFEKILFKRFRDEKKGHKMIVEKNFFIEKFLFRFGTKRKLNKEEKDYYRSPYPTIESRKPIAVWPKEIPINETPKRNHLIVSNYAEWLKRTEIPKLLLYAKPGMILKKKEVQNIEATFRNIKSVYIGKGRHYIQEDHPHEIGNAIEKWVDGLINN